MPRNEEGEFELILGNRQLLSVFFIVVVLLGVFFTMGYIVGRNSTPLTEIAATPAKQESKPLVVEAVPKPPEPEKKEAPPATPPTETAAQQPPPATEKQKEPEPPKREPERKETRKSEPRRELEKAARATSNEPVAGSTYLQLAATAKHEAEIMVDLLRKKQFPSIAAEVPEKPGLYRVLVGPLAEGAATRTKSQLQDAGFPGNKAIRKTF